MLYACHGSNYDAIQQQLREIRNGCPMVRYEPLELSYNELDGYISGGLFSIDQVIVLDRCFTDDEHETALRNRLQSLQDSPTTFVIVEDFLNKERLKALEQVGATVTKHTKKDAKHTKDTFNVFVLADCYLDRDVKNLWVNYHKAIRSGAEPEQLHGLIWWQLVNAIVVLEEQKNPGLNEFAYKKIQNKQGRLTLANLYDDASDMVRILHQSRSEGGELSGLLEEWILSLK